MDIRALELATQAMEPGAEDAVYYRLASYIDYGGWKDYPAYLVNRINLQSKPVYGVTKTVLDLATGKINFNLPFIPQEIRDEAARLERQGNLERCAYGAEARTFHYHDNHFVLTGKWAITGRCNYKCKHCFLSAPDARFGELSTEDCKRIIRQMAEVGIQGVDLTGGEPLVRSDFMELVDELVKYNIKILDISTNGSLVSERLLDQLEERGLKPKFFMSFDGVGWHDWLRGMEGAEKMLMGKFELLAKRGYLTGSALTLHKRNVGVLRESINRLASVGVELAIINRMLNFGEWQKYGQDFNITHKEVFDTYLEYLPHFYEDGMPIKVYLNRMITLYKHSYEYRIQAVKPDPNCLRNQACPAPYRSVFITGDGRVAPCISIAGMEGQEKNFADLSQMHLRDAIENSAFSRCVGQTVADYFAHNRECDECEYKLYCQGGCRAQALEFDENDYMGIDRHRCEFFRGNYAQKIIQRLAETVPQAHVTYFPENFPFKPLED